MQEQGIDLDSFQQEQRLSSKILEKVIGGTDQSDDPRNCHDRSVGSGPNHDRSHDKVHSKSILHSRCDHPKKIGIANQKIDFLKVKSAKVISTMRLDLE